MKYYIDENGYLFEIAPDDATGENVYDAGEDVELELRLTWNFNNYSFWKWKYVDETLTENENIKLYAIVTLLDSVELLTDTFTKSDFDTLPSGVEDVIITIEQASDLFGDCGTPNYKIVNDEVITRTESEKLSCNKIKKDEELKNDYLTDILWTDDSKEYYDKFKIIHPDDTSKDAWFAGVMTYWDEGRTEREINKTDLENATTLAQIEAITYDPTHE